MKKSIAMILVLLTLLSASAFATENEPVTGGWIMPETVHAKLPQDAASAFSKAIEGLAGCSYEPVAYLGFQVVAGINYCILCKAATVTQNPETGYVLMYIYADLNGNAQISSIAHLDIGALSLVKE